MERQKFKGIGNFHIYLFFKFKLQLFIFNK